MIALKVQEEAINSADNSKLRAHFTGEALNDLLRRIERRTTSTGQYTTVGIFMPRVMDFMHETTVPGVYEVVDARTETISTVERLPNGKPGKVVRPGEPARVCYSVQMIKESGRWKVQSEDVETGGIQGGRCPPYWS